MDFVTMYILGFCRRFCCRSLMVVAFSFRCICIQYCIRRFNTRKASLYPYSSDFSSKETSSTNPSVLTSWIRNVSSHHPAEQNMAPKLPEEGSPARAAMEKSLTLNKKQSWFGSIKNAVHQSALSAKAAVESLRNGSSTQ